MVWFFLAIVTFPVLFMPDFYIDLTPCFLISISNEGLALVLTTSSEYSMSGLDKLLWSLSQRFSVVRELLAVAVTAEKFLPMVFAETEDYFSSLQKIEGERGYQKIRAVVHSVWSLLFEFFLTLIVFNHR